ncbi:MAG: hypothetical protein R3C14_44620 [Caldilineaceae bacterium]
MPYKSAFPQMQTKAQPRRQGAPRQTVDLTTELIQRTRVQPTKVTAHEAEQLQSMLGNRAVQQLLGKDFLTKNIATRTQLIQMDMLEKVGLPDSRKDSSATAIVQRAKLNRRQNGTISGISQWSNRPTSNLRSGQGRHLTAYVVFQDTILSNVRDKTPTEAANQLILVIDVFLDLPAMRQRNNFNGLIIDSFNVIKGKLSDASKETDEKSASDIIGTLIDEILSARNKIPGTAISESDSHGHGEAGSAGILEKLETALRKNEWNSSWNEDVVAREALESIWYLFDYNPPDPANDDNKLDDIQKRVLTHVMSIRLAYPCVFDWLTQKGQNYWLMPYLIKNNKSMGMPLQQVASEKLQKVQEYVHAGL